MVEGNRLYPRTLVLGLPSLRPGGPSMLKPKQSSAIHGSVRASFKWLLPFLVGAFLALSPTLARADEISVAGSTSGSFTGTGVFGATGLNFTGSTFPSTATLNGLASIPLGSISLGP